MTEKLCSFNSYIREREKLGKSRTSILCPFRSFRGVRERQKPKKKPQKKTERQRGKNRRLWVEDKKKDIGERLSLLISDHG